MRSACRLSPQGKQISRKNVLFLKTRTVFFVFSGFFFALKWHSIHETVTQRQTAVVARPRIVVKIGPGLRRRLIASRIQKIAFG